MRSSRLIVLALVSACSSPPPDEGVAAPGDAGLVRARDGGAGGATERRLRALAIEPAMLALTTDGVTAAVARVTVRASYDDGGSEDVTARARLGVDDALVARVDAGTVTSATDRGGKTNLWAELSGVRAQAPLVVVYARVHDDARAGALPAVRFDGAADAARAPEVVYPDDGVLLPPNLRGVEIHYRAAGQSVFELSLEHELVSVRIRTRCTSPTDGGCIYTPDAALWRALAATTRGAGPVRLVVRGTDDAGAGVGSSSPIELAFSRDDLEGAVYYWTTSGGTSIMRYDFGAHEPRLERFTGPEQTGGTCVGCHALSRDGSRIVAEAGGQNDGRLLLLDVARALPVVPFGQTGKSVFESWAPDAARFVGVYGDAGATDWSLQLFDGATGQVQSAIAGTGTREHPADHPDWSPDGDRIAYVHVGIPGTMQRMSKGSIEMVTERGGVWSPPETLVPEEPGKNRYYPAFSPDGKFVLYDESTCPSGEQHMDCNADSDPSARLWVVGLGGARTPIELAAANRPGRGEPAGSTELTSSFPKWAPFVSQSGELGTLMWLSMSSSRYYGLRRPPAGGDENRRGTLLWMTAFDPQRAERGLDPSRPPFVLPFQDVTTSNHIAQWTTRIVPPPG